MQHNHTKASNAFKYVNVIIPIFVHKRFLSLHYL